MKNKTKHLPLTKPKKVPQIYEPQDCALLSIADYATQQEITPARVYQLFQEDKIEVVRVGKNQFVKSAK